jgi:putative oxidoreductase
LAREKPPWHRYLPFAGRLLIGLAFTMTGLSKPAAYGATIDLIVSSKLPLPPPLAYAGAIMVEIGCGVLMIAGYRARAAAGGRASDGNRTSR